MKKGKKDEDNPHFPTFFTFLPIIIVLFLFPDFVIVSPKNLRQRV